MFTALGVRFLLPPSMWADFGGDIAAAAGYFVNFGLAARSVDYLAQDVVASPVQHYWSLSVEEQFYLIWPALLFFAVVWAARRQKSTKLAVGSAVLVLVVLPSLAFNMWFTNRSPAAAFFITPTRLWQLGAGGLIASIWHRFSTPAVLVVPLKIAALAALAWTSMVVDASVPWPGVMAVLPVVATGTLILLGGRQSDVVERTLSVFPLQRVGAWSYSIYLWHWPPLALLAARWGELTTRQAVVITALAFIPAVLSYRYIENPIRFHESLVRAPALSISTGICLSLVGVVTGLVVMLQVPDSGPQEADVLLGARILEQGLSSEELLSRLRNESAFLPRPENATRDRPTLYDEGCQVDQDSPTPIVCERGDPNGSTTLMVIGDSKIAQYVPALDEIGERRGWKVVTTTKSSCALSATTPIIRDGPYGSCRDWGQQVLDLVEEIDPSVVLLSQGSSQAWDEESGAGSVELMRQGMLAAYERIANSGASIVMIRNNVIGDFVVRDCVSANPEALERCIIPWEAVDGKGSGVLQERVAAEVGYALIDPTPLLCPEQLCLPVIGGVLVYRDGSHITATYVKTMIPFLEEQLVAAAAGRLP